MWYLVILVLTHAPFIHDPVTLETFTSEAACIEVRDLVREGMANAYPADRSYEIHCLQKT